MYKSNECLFKSFTFASVPWQQSHDTLVSLYKDVEMGTFVPNSISGIWQDRRREDNQLINSLLAHFSKSNRGRAKAKARRAAAYEVWLI